MNETTPRVFHLLGRPSDFQTERSVEALTALPGARQERIGPGGRWLNVPTALLGLGQASRGFDFVHCWDDRALVAAALGCAGPIIYSPPAFPTARGVRLIRSMMAVRGIRVVCPTATMQRHLIRRGVLLERCQLVRPGVDFSRIKRRKDIDLRRRLGIGPDDFVILAPGESTADANHELAVLVGSILHVLDARYRLLFWGRGAWAHRAAMLGTKLGQPNLVCHATERLGPDIAFESLISASDAVVISATGPVSILPIAVCMAAALPIVSTVTPTVAELLEDRHTALIAPLPKARLLAQRILALREDAALQWTISDRARKEAFELWPLTQFLEGWRNVYKGAQAGPAVSAASLTC